MQDYFSSVRSDSSLAALRAAGSAEILELATRKLAGKPRFGPDIDGYFLPRSIPAIYAAGDQAHVPLIAGWNQDEEHNAGRRVADNRGRRNSGRGPRIFSRCTTRTG